MIRINKPHAPQQLTRGDAITTRDCEAYDAAQIDYKNGTIRFHFNRQIYSHSTVRKALEQAHNGKCCFCEGKSFGPFSPAHVEHYRPKGSVKQSERSRKILPGYFWLAYSWDNLYWCCHDCNSSNKRNLFPLKDPSKRARSHADDLAKEEPLILDPGGKDDPNGHIGFHKEVAKGLTEIGRTTIQVVGLNRSTLEEARRSRMARLKSLLNIVVISRRITDDELKGLAEKASSELKAAVLPSAEFSAMATEFVNQNAGS